MSDDTPFRITVVNQRTTSCLVLVHPAGEAIQLRPGSGTLIHMSPEDRSFAIEVHEEGGIDISARTASTVVIAQGVASRRRYFMWMGIGAAALLLICLAGAWLMLRLGSLIYPGAGVEPSRVEIPRRRC